MGKIKVFIIAIVGLLLLTACGKVEYNIVFSDNGNRTVVTVLKGEILAKPSDPVRSGYIFLGWFKNLTDEKSYDFSSKVTGNFTLYAKWEKTNSGDLTCNVKCEDGYHLTTACVCEKDKSGSDEDAKLTLRTVKDEKIVRYTIKFDSAGGSDIYSQSVISGNKAIKPSNPIKEGYEFLGWYLDGNLYNFNVKVVKNITLVAKWEKIETSSQPSQTVVPSVLSYKIEPISDSMVGQVKVYLTKDGSNISGNADIVTKSGKTINKDIPKEGYVTNGGVIDKIINIKIN